MTPETRAARDRIEAFMTAFGNLPAERKDPGVPSRIAFIPSTENRLAGYELSLIDLARVLAALDAQPAAIIQCDHQLTEEQAEDLKRRFLAAQHDGTPARWLDVDNREGTFTPHEPSAPFYPEDPA